ncbi:MAG: Membrane protein [Gammaproteobacteria bacterium]|jgi:hypothetical protein|nr:Membrane protein [Gammaproteobacteria bacterium]
MDIPKYTDFKEFYRYYLTQHQNPICRFLHVVGTLSAGIFILLGLICGVWMFLIFAVLCGYGFAWLGHFIFERNRPATFKQPLYSLMADFVMLKDILFDKLPNQKK